MASTTLQTVIHHLQSVAGPWEAGRLTDAELLERIVPDHDRAALEVLVWRHGPLVLKVCRRILRREQDVDDAFQATFLTFLRKVGSIHKREAVGSWLYKVAYRTALEAKALAARRAARETSEVETLAARSTEDLARRGLGQALDEEVSRLPDKYRVPLVLYHLEGKTSGEVARQVGCPEATLRTRLARARERLRVRLVRRGLALSSGLLVVELAGNAATAVPLRLVDATLEAAARFATGKAGMTGAAGERVATLAGNVLQSLFLNTLKKVTVAVLLLGVVAAGTGLSLRQALAGRPVLDEKDNLPQAAPVMDQPKDDQAAMQGTWESWTTETRVVNGNPLPPRQVKLTWAIMGDQLIQVGNDGCIDQQWTFKLDPIKKPKAIDLTERRTGRMRGIYLLEGNTLKMYFDVDGKRPTAFPAKAETLWVLTRVSRTPVKATQRYVNAPGCYWMIEPGSPSMSMYTLGLGYFYEKDPDGAVLITLAYPVADGRLAGNLYPVLLDAGRKRYLPKLDGGGYSILRAGFGTALYRWRMDPTLLPPEKVALLGIEALTPAAERMAAHEAQERARKARVELLPWPEVGKAYSFTLTTLDGRTLRSADLKGKVVVIDCWAGWCSPCMALMPELKGLYKKWHKEGLEIIGINLDQQAATAQKLAKSANLPWPQVWVPADDQARKLWQQASGIESIPRVLVLDREGILRADGAGQLEETIARLLAPAAAAPVRSRP
jgi:RNA polymerase sigma factor (sigma-70 family)